MNTEKRAVKFKFAPAQLSAEILIKNKTIITNKAREDFSKKSKLDFQSDFILESNLNCEL